MDAEVFVSFDDRGDVASIPAVVFHYVPPESQDPTPGSFYFVHGKFSCMESSVGVGDGFSSENYELLIEADFVCPPLPSLLFGPI